MDATHPAPDADRHDPLAPEWLRWLRAIGWRLVVTLALAASLVAIAVALSTTTVSVIVSILVASACSPYIQHMRSRGWSRSKAAAAGTLGVVGMASSACFLAVPLLGVISATWRSVLQVMGDRPPTPSVATDVGATDHSPPEASPPDTASQPATASG